MATEASGALARHTAAPSLAGFVYQIQAAIQDLFVLEEGEALGIEVLDDIDVERDGVATSLSQVKLHQGHRPVNLTDGSEDLWKTLGIWAAAVSDGSLDLSVVQRLLLITTAAIPAGSIAEMVCRGDNPELIDDRLLTVPVSQVDTLRAAQIAVRDLDREQRLLLIRRLVIHANQPGLASYQGRVQRELRRCGFRPSCYPEVVDRLSGWVWVKIGERLGSLHGVRIEESEFRAALSLIRDDMSASSLPVRFADRDASNIDPTILVGQTQTMYIRQLDLVGASPRVKERSIINFFRASSERSEWIARGELLPDKLSWYDRDLVERWRPAFEDVCIRMKEADEAMLRSAGYGHFRQIEDSDVPIHPGCPYRYITTGSYHMLADDCRVGWHPDYGQLLEGSRDNGAP